VKKYLFIALLTVLSVPVCSQPLHIDHQISSQICDPLYTMGRDVWFAIPENDQSSSIQNYTLQITAPKNAIVFVEMAGVRKTIHVFANSTYFLSLGRSLEMKTSGVVENLAIHVYSTQTDLACCVVQSGTISCASADGAYALPSIGWGTDYVVAAYAALFETSGTTTWDYPSEFTVCANQDNTVVTITPSCDIRKDPWTGNSSAPLLHAKGTAFSERLNRGETVQYRSMAATNAEDFDVTGTFVHANVPVGISAGSVCPNIPSDYTRCNEAWDIIPPIRLWGQTYYTLPYQRHGGSPSHDASTFLMITTKANQTIHRHDLNGDFLEFSGSATFDHSFDATVSTASKWTSDAPFFLAQYHNSQSYPDWNDDGADGGPSMSKIVDAEQYAPTILYQGAVGGNYENAAALIYHAGDKSLTMDGATLSGKVRRELDGNYLAIPLTSITGGTHVVHADSGVTLSGYGMGVCATYAWSSPYNMRTFHCADSMPPVATIQDLKGTTRVTFRDTGTNAAMLSRMTIDSVFNIQYQPDPNFIEGSGRASTYYDLTVDDPGQSAYLKVTVYDAGGNHTTVTSHYIAPNYHTNPSSLKFGRGNNSACTYRYDTLINSGLVEYTFRELRLSQGNVGFTIDSASLTPMAAGERRAIKICFRSIAGGGVTDTMLFGDTVLEVRTLLSGGLEASTIAGNDTSVTIEAGDTVTTSRRVALEFFVQATGNAPSTITEILHHEKDSGFFHTFTVARMDGSVLPETDTMYELLAPGAKLFARDTVDVSLDRSATYFDTIFVFETKDGIMHRVGEPLIGAVSVVASAATVTDHPIRNRIAVYPMPIKTATTIILSSDRTAHCEVSLVNCLGVEVAKIFSGQLDTEREIQWQRTPDLRAGIYECVARIGNEVHNARMIVE
jgi:hypothetical protein